VRVVIVILLLAATAPAKEPKPFKDALADIDRRTAVRLTGIAGKAARLRQHATARRIYERALKLDAENRKARAMLGFKKGHLGWDRPSDKESEINRRKDEDASKVANARRGLVNAEEWRAKQIAKACVSRKIVEAERARLLGLLRRTPRVKEVHQALGHTKQGKLWVRPEFERVAKAMKARVAAWRACGIVRGPPKATGRFLIVPGYKKRPPLFQMDGFKATAWQMERTPGEFAAITPCAYQFVDLVAGTTNNAWRPDRICFMSAKAYRKMVYALHPDEATRKQRMRWIGYTYKYFFALRVYDYEWARDFHAHQVGYKTMQNWVETKQGGSFEWFCEGFAYFTSLELNGTAILRFASAKGTGDKLRYSLPAPEEKTDKTVWPWLRANLEDDLCIPLSDLCNRSLNQLDFLGSIQACSLIRFLALWDATAFQRLPAALRSAEGSNDRERTEFALKQVYGMGYAKLEPLWLSFTLEIGLP